MIVTSLTNKPTTSAQQTSNKPATTDNNVTNNDNNEKNIPTFEEFKNYALQNEPSINLVNLKHKYEAWKEDGWRCGKERRKIKNWKTTLLNSIQYIGTTENNIPPAYKKLKI